LSTFAAIMTYELAKRYCGTRKNSCKMFKKQPVLLRLCKNFDRGIGQVIQPHGLFGVYQL
jgi:hypothetical protein